MSLAPAASAVFEERLASVATQIERELDAILSASPHGAPDWPASLGAAMRHAVLGGGKRLRPFLVAETARLLGREDRGALLAGCAIELLHCYSLVHDDLPAMDDDDLRRGRPTVHKAFDEATAILAGDALLTLAFAVMADEALDPDPALRVALVAGLAAASGAAGMVGGQSLDLALAAASLRGDASPAETDIRRMQAMKTGALLAFSVEAGALLGRARAPERAHLADYGHAIGAAFQVADDILDVEATAAVLGKAAGKDAGMGKATLVAALGIERAKAERDRLVGRAGDALASFGPRGDVLRAAAAFVGRRRS